MKAPGAAADPAAWFAAREAGRCPSRPQTEGKFSAGVKNLFSFISFCFRSLAADFSKQKRRKVACALCWLSQRLFPELNALLAVLLVRGSSVVFALSCMFKCAHMQMLAWCKTHGYFH